jgi:hypothetical protein
MVSDWWILMTMEILMFSFLTLRNGWWPGSSPQKKVGAFSVGESLGIRELRLLLWTKPGPISEPGSNLAGFGSKMSIPANGWERETLGFD